MTIVLTVLAASQIDGTVIIGHWHLWLEEIFWIHILRRNTLTLSKIPYVHFIVRLEVINSDFRPFILFPDMSRYTLLRPALVNRNIEIKALLVKIIILLAILFAVILRLFLWWKILDHDYILGWILILLMLIILFSNELHNLIPFFLWHLDFHKLVIDIPVICDWETLFETVFVFIWIIRSFFLYFFID